MNKQAPGVRVTFSFSPEYAAEDATMSIDRLIKTLEEAKAEGATEIVGFSGNRYGPRYARVTAEIDYLDEDVEDYGL